MKAIKITEANLSKLQAALDERNGKAKRHTLKNASKILDIAARAEKALESYGLPKNLRASAIASYFTRLGMERRTTGWFLAAWPN